MGRVVTVIAEGATPYLLERWMAAGALPSFTALRGAGEWGDFKSLPVPYELPALASAFTGAPPGTHGCFSMWHTHGPAFDSVPEMIASGEVGATFIWHLHEAARMRVAVVNVIGTHPPTPVNGYLISYPFTPTLRGCHPPGLLRELSSCGIGYGHDVSAFYGVTPAENFVPLVERIERARIAACLELLRRGTDFHVFNITIIDRLSHFFWREVEGTNVDADGTALWMAYRLLDNFIGRLLDELRPDDHLLVFSEIGFGPLCEYVSVNDILAGAGLLTSEDGRVDPSRTLAMEAVQGTHGVNLNLRRRYAGGLIADADEERMLAEVGAALLAALNPKTGGPLFADVNPGRQLYPGPNSDRAPDLVMIPADERYLPLGHPYWANKVSRRSQTGWHRRESFWCGVGPKFRGGAQGAAANPMDVAATLCDCLDLEVLLPHAASLVNAKGVVSAADV